ncbi:hypothetical protein NE237_006772 [Protea cynaroides]|uniref:Uncharacterized protein n=1 Tax=Protea cynaroides TaxID=273540 RepID=A0A9Q0KN20_9MAGN|nr:hypothetical protein NE237_006772 [Protea cynaroides]
MESLLLDESPSFNSYSCDVLAEIVAKVVEEFKQESFQDNTEEEFEPPPLLSQSINDEPQQEEEQNEDGDEDDEGNDEDDNEDDFEFAIVGKDIDFSTISADKIFDNGQIRPVFPIFNRALLFADGADYDSKPRNKGKHIIEERENDNPHCSSSSEDELESIPDEIYCVWDPKPGKTSPEICKKSNSTGFTKRSWKFRDLLYRSNSEGMDTYVFLTPPKPMMKRDDKTEKVADREGVYKADQFNQQRPPKMKSTSVSSQVNVAGKGKMKVKRVSGETVSAHEIHYVRYRALKEEDRRRSYLPYRQDLVGLFANPNGVTKNNLHPF